MKAREVIARELRRNVDLNNTSAMPWSHQRKARQRLFLEQADAILAALAREGPTEGMRMAGADGLKFWIGDNQWQELVHGEPDVWPDVEPGMTLAYRAMLTAARKEDQS